jgi:hypothetical protein
VKWNISIDSFGCCFGRKEIGRDDAKEDRPNEPLTEMPVGFELDSPALFRARARRNHSQKVLGNDGPRRYASHRRGRLIGQPDWIPFAGGIVVLRRLELAPKDLATILRRYSCANT